jgi:hypothetical protein
MRSSKVNPSKPSFALEILRILESISTELDREIEHESQKLNTTTTIKHVTIVEPPIRPAASVDEFSRTTKTVSDCLNTTSETTRDLKMLHSAYQQNLHSAPTTRVSRTHIFEPKKKVQPQKTTSKLKSFHLLPCHSCSLQSRKL